MPYAATATTATEWATDRAVSLWVLFAGDLTEQQVTQLILGSEPVKADGALFALVVMPESEATAYERALADVTVAGPGGPSPFGIFAAMEDAGVNDARQVGVLGASRSALDAGHRAGARAVVGLAPAAPDQRRHLLLSQPDHIVEPDKLAALYQERYASTRAHRQRVLLNPGPSVVSDRVHRAIGGVDLCHREPEYSDILERVRHKLLQIAEVPDDWAMVMIAGSGTAAMEGMSVSAVRPGKKLLVCRNGIYGERIESIAKRIGVPTVVVGASNFDPIDPGAVAAALDADPDIDAVAVIHHETTTGLLNPVQEIAAETNKRGVMLLVDAISSFGAEELPLEGTGIDFVASTSNKCLHGLPGCAFILISPRGQERIKQVPPTSLYFDLQAYLTAQAKKTVPYTPAIPALYSLDAALDELLDEGVEYRRDYYQRRADFLDEELGRLGLEARVAIGRRSRSVRSLPLPDGVTYDELHDALKAQGYVIYAGLGEAAKTSFRVCMLGALTVEAMQGFMTTLKQVLEPTGAVASSSAGSQVGLERS